MVEVSCSWAYGADKTTLSEELADQLEATGTPYAAIDLPQVIDGIPTACRRPAPPAGACWTMSRFGQRLRGAPRVAGRRHSGVAQWVESRPATPLGGRLGGYSGHVST